ncbi:alpha/beta hydrolase [Myceligenerans crystallogenes]|uniref:AB hydrolase-1 domain-containing protein n=1 Tax=Myceligenerans crystallogenes TaxID=316335 RepID=A0ABN2NF00_9MICO
MSVHVRVLPGLAGTPAIWEQTLAELARIRPDVTAQVADVPWHAEAGQAWAEPGWDPQQATSRLVRSGEVLVAHSFAASLTLAHLCARGVVQPRAVVLVSPFYRATAREFTWPTLEHFLTRFDEFLETGLVAQASHEIDPEIRIAMARFVRDRMGAYGWMAFMSAYLATPALDLAAATVPVHVVYGTQDRVAPPADAVTLAGLLPRAVLHPFEAADHFPMTADPARTAAVVREAIEASEHRTVVHHPAPHTPHGAVRPQPPVPQGRRQPRKELT